MDPKQSSSKAGSANSEKQELSPQQTWAAILATLEETLQLGFLEEARYVTEVTREENTLVLKMEADGPFRFFSQKANQNRVLILAKRLAGIEAIQVVQL